MNVRVPAEAFPPGDWIREWLEDRGWTQLDLAEILGRPIQLVNELIAGKKSITPETAKGLAQAFGTSPQLWMSLDAAYQLHMTREADPSVELRARIYSKAPVREMVKRHWIEYSSNPDVLEQRVLEFFGTNDLGEGPDILSAAARMSTTYEALSSSQRAWLCRARQLGKAVPVQTRFNAGSSEMLLHRLRALLGDPEEVRHVPRVLGEAGIRFLVLEHLAKTRIDGACLWLDERSPIIAVSLRYDRIDGFWFTLMHELKHALHGDGLKTGALTVDVDLVGEAHIEKGQKPELEKDADEFAENTLIRQADLNDFILRKRPLFSEASIRGFASLHSVHPGLVVGQLHYRKEIDYAKFRRLLVRIRDHLTQSALTDGWGHNVPAVL